jgi:hypothetical protein
MNKPLALQTEHLPHRDSVVGHEGGSFTGDFEVKVSYHGMCGSRFWKRVSVSVEVPLGNLGGGGGGYGEI